MARRDEHFLTGALSHREPFPLTPGGRHPGAFTGEHPEPAEAYRGILRLMLNVYDTFTGRPWNVIG